MTMVRYLKSLWYARLRRIDLKILWPSCKNIGEDLDHAKAAFAFHAFHDDAWLFLGEDKIIEIIENLK